MANCCYFELRAYGFKNESDKTSFIKVFEKNYHSPNYSNEDGKIARNDGKMPYMALYDDSDITEHENGVVRIAGNCKWSVASSMLDFEQSSYGIRHKEDKNSNYTCLEELSKHYKIAIEVYSEEPSNDFEEHYVVENGKITCKSCVSILNGGFPEDEDWNFKAIEQAVAKDNTVPSLSL